MRKATFTVTNAFKFSTTHNFRKTVPEYIFDHNATNSYIQFYNDEDFKTRAIEKYLQTKKQKMQIRQRQALIKETVLTIRKEHTLKDIRKLFKKLNKKFGGHFVLAIAIHRDEGHFVYEGIAYYPSEHIFFINGEWYIIPLVKFLDDDYRPTAIDAVEKVDISLFEHHYNYHAHVKFSMFDLHTGITGRMTKSEAGRKRLMFVAKELNLKYVPNDTYGHREAVKTIKKRYDVQRREQIKALFKIRKIEQKYNQKIERLKKNQENPNVKLIHELNNIIIMALGNNVHYPKLKDRIMHILYEYKNMEEEIETLRILEQNHIERNQANKHKLESSNKRLLALEKENLLLKNKLMQQKSSLIIEDEDPSEEHENRLRF